jgi:hypothetical protein
MEQRINDHLVLVCGKSAAGKSASLMNMRNPEGLMYLNCESGKRLPFRNSFKAYTITDPLQIFEAFEFAETNPEIHTIVVDSLTYLLDLYESVYVLNAINTMKAWGEFSQYFKTLMQHHVASSTKNVIFMAHTLDAINETDMVMETKVPVKGALKNNGIESYFSIVIAAKKVGLKTLEGYDSSMLDITPEEEALGLKYVFQTKLTKETVNERLRGPMGLFTGKETFIDNDVQLLLDRLHAYYDEPEESAV